MRTLGKIVLAAEIVGVLGYLATLGHPVHVPDLAVVWHAWAAWFTEHNSTAVPA